MEQLRLLKGRTISRQSNFTVEPGARGLSEDVGNGRLFASGEDPCLEWALMSDPGKLRPRNEDYAAHSLVTASTHLDDERATVLVVADGLGGLSAGDRASRIAVESIISYLKSEKVVNAYQAVRKAIRQANSTILEEMAVVHGLRMGTTMTIMVATKGEAVFGHVGDSRAYLLRGNAITQLTADHSQAAEMLRMGLITPEQARTHPSRSQLTRCLGGDLVVRVDMLSQPLNSGDWVVLCSDGLWNLVSKQEIAHTIRDAEITYRSKPDTESLLGHFPVPFEHQLLFGRDLLTQAKSSATQVVTQLVALALDRGAHDNVTVAAVRFMRETSMSNRGKTGLLWRRVRRRR